jgi:inhibitor of cysteine peptidase
MLLQTIIGVHDEKESGMRSSQHWATAHTIRRTLSGLLVLGGVLVFLTMLSASLAQSSDDRVTATDADDGTAVVVEEGQLLVVQLESQPGTGYTWEMDTLPPTLRQVGEPTFAQPSTLATSNDGGTPTLQVFTFQPIQAGTQTLSLVYRRPWEQGVDPIQTFTLEIETQGSFKTRLPALAATPIPDQAPPALDMGDDMGLPSAFNWCDAGGCTPVKSQGNSDCWAFATVGVVESVIKM